jgi:hypothetical protein
MDLPNLLVYDIPSLEAGGHTNCRVKDNTWKNCMRSATNWNAMPFAERKYKFPLRPVFASASGSRRGWRVIVPGGNEMRGLWLSYRAVAAITCCRD